VQTEDVGDDVKRMRWWKEPQYPELAARMTLNDPERLSNNFKQMSYSKLLGHGKKTETSKSLNSMYWPQTQRG
jgi:hypothetical protein